MSDGEAPFGRLVCVCANPSIDKIAAVERLVAGEIHRPTLLTVLPGGKGLNVARAAARLGFPATALGFVAGHAGAWLAEALDRRGVPLVGVEIAGETRTCLSVLDRSTGELTEFYEPGVPIGETDWARLEAALADELQRPDRLPLVAVSGSLPPGSPPDGYRRIATLAEACGVRVALDVGGLQLSTALAARPWLVKVNAAEASAALGMPTADEPQVLAATAALRDAGAEIVVVTRGADGAVLATGGETWRIGPPPERGRFGVGSGDAFLAGLLVGLGGGHEPAAAARHAAAVAAAHALVPGQGEFRASDAERLLAAIAVERLA